MGTEGSGASRAGMDDLQNEDAFLVEEGLGLYVVCDGLGGRPGGDVASKLAVQALEDLVSEADAQFGDALEDDTASRRIAARAIRFAMDAVLRAAETEPELAGMATTVTMLLAHRRSGVVGHVGDSRAYLIRRGRSHQLTVDHEWTDALNGDSADWGDTPVHTFAVDLRPGDTFLLCTDGAERVVEDPALVRSAGNLSPRLLASRIVSAAHRVEPEQDATVVAVRVRGEFEPAWLSLSSSPEGTAFGHTVVHVA